ncbi:MAG: inositol monophosphatase family protein [Gammaproteobacteria bacterium]|nr:inositol monophosphatase family protein [Gammaproteobacteria bacterium]
MRDPIVNIAVRAARAAGNVIIRAADRLDNIQVSEKHPHDYVTDIDRLAEREIIAIIQKAHPSHGILGEESGEIYGDNEDYLWIIDPIDGTRNFIHGFPQFAVSIAVSYKGKIQHGVIYDPVRQELFTASRGKGAQLNERRIRVSKRVNLEECLLGTGFPYRHSPEHIEAYTGSLQAILPICGDVRRAGAATLDLAYVAAGRLDGFWEMGLKPWDLAAGTLLIKEAGGIVTDFNGAEDYLDSGNVIAGNPKVLKSLFKLVRPFFANLPK